MPAGGPYRVDVERPPADLEAEIVASWRSAKRRALAIVVPVAVASFAALAIVLHDALADELARRRGVAWEPGTAIAAGVLAFAPLAALGRLARRLVPPLERAWLRRECKRRGLARDALPDSLRLM